MSFASGFLGPRGDVGFMMNADFEKAKKIVEHLLQEGKAIVEVEMGLDGDWNENSMTIFENGEFTEYHMHDSSQWAEPIILVSYEDGSNEAYSAWFREIDVEGDFVTEIPLLN